MTGQTFEGRDPSTAATPRVWQSLGRSAASSAVATLLDGTLAWSLALWLDMSGPLATLLGASAGGLMNWLLNRLWAFGSGGSARREALRYVLVSAGAALLNTLGVAWLEGTLGFQGAWLLTRGTVFLGFTFVLFRTFVFRPSSGRAVQS